MLHTAVREVADLARRIYVCARTLSGNIPCCTFQMRKRKGIRSSLYFILMPSRCFGTTLNQFPLPLYSQPNLIVHIVSSHLLLELTKSQLLSCLIRAAFSTRRTILNFTILSAKFPVGSAIKSQLTFTPVGQVSS